MEPDDVLPNDSTFFFAREPKDQILGRQKEKAQTLESLSVLKDLLARWDIKIAFYDSVRSIPEEAKASPEQFMHMVAGNAVVLEVLMAEREYIQSLIDNYAPN